MAAPSLHPPARDASLGPRTPDEAWRWLLVSVLCCAGGVALSSVFAAIGAWAGDVRGGASALATSASPPVWYLVVTFAGLWSGFGAAAWIVTRDGRSVGLRLAPGDSRYVFLGLALQLLVNLAYVDVNSHQLSGPEQKLLPGSGALLAVPVVLTVLGAPIIEELFFRGALLRGLLGLLQRSRIGVVLAVVADGVVFGLLHAGTDPWIEVPGLMAVGVVLAVLAVRTKRLGPSIVTHASFNALTVFLYVFTR